MAVSKIAQKPVAESITPTFVANDYYTVNSNNNGNLFVSRCGNVVMVTVLGRVLSDDYPTTFPGQAVANGLPTPVQNVWTAAPTSFGASVQKSVNFNMSKNDGKLYMRYGKSGFSYACVFTYLTNDP